MTEESQEPQELEVETTESEESSEVSEPTEASEPKKVDLRALQEAREENKRLKAEQQQSQSELAIWNKVKPYSHLLATHPTVIEMQKRARGEQPTPAPGQPDLRQKEAEELARELNLVDAQGQLDTRRALVLIDRQDRVANRAAEAAARRAAAPAVQNAANVSAQSMLQKAYQVVDDDPKSQTYGQLYARREAIDGVIKEYGLDQVPEYLGRPQIMKWVIQLARANGGAGGVANPSQPPIFTESPGRRPGGRPVPLTKFDQFVVEDLGLKSDDYRKTRDGLKIQDDGSVILE